MQELLTAPRIAPKLSCTCPCAFSCAVLDVYIYACASTLLSLTHLFTPIAVQLERECGLRRGQIVCYTYGTPRCGNHAWRQYAAERVPELWHVINDHDIVAKGLKIGYMYKRCGHRVVVRGSGRLAVRPSFFEFLLLQVRCPAVACDCRMLVSLTRCRDRPSFRMSSGAPPAAGAQTTLSCKC